MNHPESVDKDAAAGDYSPCESDPSIPSAPSPQQSAFEQAAQAIVCRSGSGSGAATSFGSEIRNVEEWALQHGTLVPDSFFRDLVPISNHTSEHEVFYRAKDSRAIKRTWPGVYGQIPMAHAGKLDRRNASPSEYLSRMALHIAVFGSDLRLEGVTISDKPSMIIGQPAGQPSLVISQLWYEKEGIATNEAIHDFMVAQGFRAVPASYYGWFRPTDGIVIVDAKPDNFIRTSGGLIAIDLQMAQFSTTELLACGLTSFPSAPTRFLCPDCGHQHLLAFTCKSRHFCPACHQRRTLHTGAWIAQSVCHPVTHRQFVFTIPKMLRGIFRKRRHLLHLLFQTATDTLRDAFRIRTRLNLS